MTPKEKDKSEDIKKQEIEKGILGSEITEEMEKAYIDYAMSVIVARALPSVEDGLKPVHRRILYSMLGLGLKPSSITKKSARIIGETMGKYHPHGDLAIYDSLVRMAQPFSLRYPLIKGQGNFGNIDGDSAAASRYTEAKLTSLSIELLKDLNKQTVKFMPNFDGSLKEPEVLPAKIPNLLINGASGIAVGMATNIPPHNLTEVSDAILKYIENPEINIDKLVKIIPGPDFPTGGHISGNFQEIYKTGKGRITIRGKTSIEKTKKGREKIIIQEIPYQVNKADLITQIATLVSNKKIQTIKDMRDESSKGKVRIVIELRKDSDPKFTINRLYKYSRLQDRFDANLIGLVKGKPQSLNLKKIIEVFVNHRKKVIEKRTKFELKKAKDRLEVIQGLLIALKDIDSVISIIKKASNTTEAKEQLGKKYQLSIKQTEAILEIKLSTLTKLETDNLKKEGIELKTQIKDLEKILSSEKNILEVVRKETLEIKRKYGDNRKTSVLQNIKQLEEKDLVQKKEVVITITDKGYVKRMNTQTYKQQKRGGRGVIGSDLSTGDFIKQLLTCSTHDYLLFFTSRGRVLWLKAYEIPSAERYSKGKAIINILKLRDETIQSVISVKKFEDYLIFATKKGIVKRLELSQLSKPRASGVRAINLPKDNSDFLINVKCIKPEQEVLLVTKKGQAIRFNSNNVRAMGRASYGVTGIKLNKGDEVVSLEVLPIQNSEKQKEAILTITEKGYGKRSKIEDYRLISRAGKGVINMKVTNKTGDIVRTVAVKENDSIIVTTGKGMVIRTDVKPIRIMGRATQGVRIVKLKPQDKVVDIINVRHIEEVSK